MVNLGIAKIIYLMQQLIKRRLRVTRFRLEKTSSDFKNLSVTIPYLRRFRDFPAVAHTDCDRHSGE